MRDTARRMLLTLGTRMPGLTGMRDAARLRAGATPRRVIAGASAGLTLAAATIVVAGSAPVGSASLRPSAAAVLPGNAGGAAGRAAATSARHPALPSGQPTASLSGPGGAGTSSPAASSPAPPGGLLRADLLVVGAAPLSPSVGAAVGKLPGVAAAQQIDAARLQVDGKAIAMLGVNPSAFRAFSAQPTADSASLWRNVADGGIALSYTMGTLDKVPAGHAVRVAGRRTEELPLAGLGTVGIAGVDGVVSDAVARSLGIPAGNAIVISAPDANLSSLTTQVSKLLPPGTSVAPLVAQAVPLTTGSSATQSAATGSGLTGTQVVAFLKAAESRLGLPYVWGGDGPDVFDCSGLVQWSMKQAGIVMPRVAADQALTGPQVPVSQLQPGDLLFYHTDPTAPDYISHVAIYLGDDVMLQAPEPGLDVEAVPASFGSEYAGAVRVYPKVAASVAAETAS
jgi:peptidoglycan DL-endopeptidase CwlO